MAGETVERTGSLVIRTSRRKQAQALVGLTGFFVLEVLVFVWFSRWIGGIGMAVFATVIVLALVGLVREPITLATLSPSGIELRKPALTVPWSDIASVRVRNMPLQRGLLRHFAIVRRKSNRTIVFVPVDAQRSMMRFPPRRRKLLPVTLKLYGGAVVLMEAIMEPRLDDVVETAARLGGLPVEHDV